MQAGDFAIWVDDLEKPFEKWTVRRGSLEIVVALRFVPDYRPASAEAC